MYQINIHEAKTHLSRLLERVEAGEVVIIARNGKPIAKVIKYEPVREPRKPGILKGQIRMTDDFDETSQDIIDSFYNGSVFPNEK